jgi:hypothetical protein
VSDRYLLSGYGGSGASFNAASPLLFNRILHGVDRALILPGSASDYASIESVNWLDADTAHLHQSVGSWSASLNMDAPAQSTDLTPAIGDYHGAAAVAAGGPHSSASVETPTGTNGVPVAASTQYSVTARLASDTASRVGWVQVRWYDAVGSLLDFDSGSAVNLQTDGWTTATVTATSHASAAFAAIRIRFDAVGGGDVNSGDTLYFDAACFRAGSDATFVPSLNIVGSLDVRWRGSHRDWVNGGNGSTFLGQWNTGDNLRAWAFHTDGNGHLECFSSDDGTNEESETSGTVPTNAGDMVPISTRLVLVPGGSSDTKFYESTDSNLTSASWTQVGSGQTTTDASLISGVDSPITIGYRAGGSSGSDEQPMIVHAVQIYDGDLLVCTVDFTTGWTEGDTSGESDQGHTVTIDQGSGVIAAGITQRSCWVTPDGDYLSWPDDDAYTIADDDDVTIAVSYQSHDNAPATTGSLVTNYTSSRGVVLQIYEGSSTLLAVAGDGSNTASSTIANAVAADEWSVLGAVIDGAGDDDLTAYADTTEDATPGSMAAVSDINPTTALSVGAATNAFSAGWYSWFAWINRTLTEAERDELAAWDGTIATEPSWLRTAATLYVNADDPRTWNDYQALNLLTNLAGPSDFTMKVEMAFGNDWEDYADWSWTDVTSDVIEFTTNRGGTYTQFEAGTCTVVLANSDGDYTPGNTQSAHSPNVVPGTPIRVTVTTEHGTLTDVTHTLFTGFVWGWTPRWGVGGKGGECQAYCVDGFKILANAALTSNITAGVASDQVDDILDDVSWPAGARDIETSDTTFQSIVTEAANALDTLRLVADSEGGAVLMDPTGKVAFWDDSYLAGLSRSASLWGSDLWSAELVLDDENVFNTVLVQPIDGALQTSTDATSIGKYGPRTLARFGTLHANSTDASDVADALLAVYKDPSVRLQAFQIKPIRDLQALPDVAASLGLGDVVRVSFDPENSDTFASSDHVQSVQHSYSRSEHVWVVTVATTPSLFPAVQDGTTLARFITPGSLPAFVLAQDLQSDNYAAGSDGWKIERDTGSAEFNDVTVRGTVYASAGTFAGSLSAATGTFSGTVTAATIATNTLSGTVTLSSPGKIQTAASGQRIELDATYGDRINLFTGNVSEDYEAYITGDASPMALLLVSPGQSGGSRSNAYLKEAEIELRVGTGTEEISITNGAVAVAGTLGVTGAVTLSSTLGVTGAATMSSTLTVSGVFTASNQVRTQIIRDTSGNARFQVTNGVFYSGGSTVVLDLDDIAAAGTSKLKFAALSSLSDSDVVAYVDP